jgi:selenocysteine-specific elongation factor
MVLDVAPVLPAARARPTLSVDRVIAERGWVDADELERLTGERRPPTVGRWVVSAQAKAATLEGLQKAVEAAGPLGLDQATLDDRQRALLPLLEGVVVEAGRIRQADAGDPLVNHPYVAALAASPFAPPEPTGVSRPELHELVRRGLIVEQDGCWFAPSAIEEAARQVARLLASHPEGVTVAQVREALNTTRKYALPLLNRLDADGVTRRRGDLRIAGPRLPAA